MIFKLKMQVFRLIVHNLCLVTREFKSSKKKFFFSRLKLLHPKTNNEMAYDFGKHLDHGQTLKMLD